MNIDFFGADAQFIQNQVKAGKFSNPEEVVYSAVKHMREHMEVMHKRLTEALALGEADIQAGRVVEYTPQLLEQIAQEAMQHAAEGRKPNPDVC